MISASFHFKNALKRLFKQFITCVGEGMGRGGLQIDLLSKILPSESSALLWLNSAFQN